MEERRKLQATVDGGSMSEVVEVLFEGGVVLDVAQSFFVFVKGDIIWKKHRNDFF